MLKLKVAHKCIDHQPSKIQWEGAIHVKCFLSIITGKKEGYGGIINLSSVPLFSSIIFSNCKQNPKAINTWPKSWSRTGQTKPYLSMKWEVSEVHNLNFPCYLETVAESIHMFHPVWNLPSTVVFHIGKCFLLCRRVVISFSILIHDRLTNSTS